MTYISLKQHRFITTVNQALKTYKKTAVLLKNNYAFYLVLLSAGTVLVVLLFKICPLDKIKMILALKCVGCIFFPFQCVLTRSCVDCCSVEYFATSDLPGLS